jgi:hypothetical protein
VFRIFLYTGKERWRLDTGICSHTNLSFFLEHPLGGRSGKKISIWILAFALSNYFYSAS